MLVQRSLLSRELCASLLEAGRPSASQVAGSPYASMPSAETAAYMQQLVWAVVETYFTAPGDRRTVAACQTLLEPFCDTQYCVGILPQALSE